MDATRKLALVTGASSGLGTQFAHVLAEQGYDIIVTARRRERLDLLQSQIAKSHEVQVYPLAADLAQAAGVDSLLRQVADIKRPVHLLVNNAGMGTYGPLLGQRDEQIDEMIQVNLVSLTRLTRHFAETMKGQGSGSILQISSYAGLQPIPRYAVYSATKAYVIAFTQALRYEFRKCGLKTSVCCPGFMATEFHDVAQHRKTRAMRMLTVDARRVAEQAIRGLERGKLVITPGWWYGINNLVLRFLPRSTSAALAAGVVKSKEA